MNDGKSCQYVKYIYNPERVIGKLNDRTGTITDGIVILNMKGDELVRFNTSVDNLEPALHIFPRYLLTAEKYGSLR